MKYKYIFTKPDKIITKPDKVMPLELTDSTMFVYKKYLKLGYKVTKRYIFIDGSWIDIEILKRKLTEIL